MYHSKYDFIIENDNTLYIIENDVFLIFSEIVMSRDSNRCMTSEMNSLYINQLWTMVEAPMGVTQQVANRNVNLDFLLAIATYYPESLSLVG